MIDPLLKKVKDQGLHRKRLIADHPSLRFNFSSSDYLSLSKDKRLKNAFQRGFELYPTGSTASMAVSGYFGIHQTLESSFAQLLDVEAGLLFSSGYAANLAIISFLAKANIHLLIDKGIHASFYDGIALSKPKSTRFLHQNSNDLSQKIANIKNQKMVVVEGIFSMSGQKPDLSTYGNICEQSQSLLLVDEAHSFGVLGPQGRGSIAASNISSSILPLRMIPFGKSLAAQGAIVLGRASWIDALFQSARSAIYSTALSPALAYGVLKSLELLILADDKRQNLTYAIDYFRNKIKNSSLKWRDSSTAIQQLKLGCPHKALYFTDKLYELGILCLAMRQPTVSRQDTGLRIVLNAHHDSKEIDHLFNFLEQVEEKWRAER